MMILCIAFLLLAGLVLLQRRSFLGIVFGLILVSNGINLSIFYGSHPEIGMFAFITPEIGNSPSMQSNDPLPQALVLTAIVIGFALLGFVVALVKKLTEVVGDFDAPAMKQEDSGE